MARTHRLCLLVAGALWAHQVDAQRAPTLREWMSLATPDVPRISPDGNRVAYMVVTPEWGRNDFERHVWIVSTADGKSRRLTSDSAFSWDPRWSPDGKSIAFRSSRGSGTQVYIVRLPDGVPVQLTKADNGVDDFRWAPNGQQIAFLSGQQVKPAAPEPKEFHVVGNDGVYSTALWVIDVPKEPTGPVPAVRITDPNAFAADDIAWSPDSRRIAFHGNAYDDPYSFWTYDIYVVDVATRATQRIVDTPGPQFWPLWSPDGTQIVYRTYVTAPGQEYYTHLQGILAVVRANGGTPRILTDQFDEQATPVAWTNDGIYFVGRQRTYEHLYRIDPATKVIRRLSEPVESQSFAFTFSADGRVVGFVRADATHYQEIFSGPVNALATARRLTSFGDQLANWSIASREIVSWQSKDGTPIEGVLLKPPRFDAKKRHPVAVIVHGGPLGVDQASISRDYPYVAEMYAQLGFLVLRPNYRGSIGYGARFRAALVGNLGAKEYEDVVTGVDMLVRQGIADSARVGIMGWSHGGYIAAFSATYGDRFAATSVGAGVSDVRLFYTLGDGSTLKPSDAAPTPWDDPEYFRRISPLTYVKNAHTPTLIQHGENDNTAPIAGARELYQALKDRGVQTKFVIYRGAGHLPNGLKQFQTVAEHNIEWFTQLLQPTAVRP